jgi:TRAP-type C4-dicarboxylate transport system substrate-binding protein
MFGFAAKIEAAETEKQVDLAFASGWPKGNSFGYLFQELYAETVEKISKESGKGMIKIKYEDAGRLLSFPEMLDGCKKGIADIVGFEADHVAGKAPLLGAIKLPYTFSSGRDLSAVVLKYFEEQPDIKEQLVRWDFKVLYVPRYTDPQEIHLIKPVNSLSDLKGRRIRTAGGVCDLIIKAIGAEPVTLKSGETYTALSRGVVDGALMGVTSFYDWKWYEICKYTLVQNPPIIHPVGITGINSKKFASLPKWAQEILEEAAKQVTELQVPLSDKLRNDAIKTLKDRGHTFIEFTAQQMTGYVEARAKARGEWIASQGDAGKRTGDFVDKEVQKLKK